MKSVRVFHILKHTPTRTKILQVIYTQHTSEAIEEFAKYVGFICTRNSIRDKVGGTMYKNKTINAANEVSAALKGKCGDKPKYEITIILRKYREELPNKKQRGVKQKKEQIMKF